MDSFWCDITAHNDRGMISVPTLTTVKMHFLFKTCVHISKLKQTPEKYTRRTRYKHNLLQDPLVVLIVHTV